MIFKFDAGCRFTWVLAVCIIGAASSHAALTVDSWTPLFKGVEVAGGLADTNEPVLQKVKVIRVDLRDPDVEFFSTPSDDEEGLETFSETTSEFLQGYGLQVAINANFFSPCCSDTPEAKDLTGVAISEGEMISPAVTFGPGSEALLISADNLASITTTTGNLNLNSFWTAIAGSDRLIQNGVIKTNYSSLDFYTNTFARSAAGLSQDGRYLILMTIDGRLPGVSLGASMADTARWLSRFGAYNGINLNGGFASTLVVDDDGVPMLLNHPSGGAEKLQGNNFGLWALPLPLTISVAPKDQTVFIQQPLALAADAVGPKPISFQWQFNGSNIPGATNKTHMIPSVTFADSGDYSIVVANPFETNVATAHITVADEVVVMAQDAVYTGNWTLSNATTNKYSPIFYFSYTTQNPLASATATFRPNIPVAGQWDVFTWYSSGSGRSSNTTAFISHVGGSKIAHLNQTTGGGQWLLLGSRLDFAAGTSGFVQLGNNTGETNKVILADAVKFRFRPPPQPVHLSGGGTINGAFRFFLTGENDSKYVIESSTNLVNWTTVTNFVMPSGGFQYSDAFVSGMPLRFYRTRLIP